MQWEARYAAVDRLWSGDPNDWLPELALGWEPGRALDLGCGEGADAVWLAEHGWDVTGLDLSATAIAAWRGASTAWFSMPPANVCPPAPSISSPPSTSTAAPCPAHSTWSNC